MTILRTIAVLSVLALVLVSALAAQEPQAGFEEEIEVSEVQLDVLVTNSRGEVVIGLEPADFVVTEDGAPVELETAVFYSNRTFEAPTETARRLGVSDVVPADRYFILFFHDERRSEPALAARRLDAARWVKDWIRKDLAGRDHVAVVRYDAKLAVVQDFTADREAMLAAVDQAMKWKDTGGNWPSRQPPLEAGPSLLRRLPEGLALRDRTTRIYDALGLVAEASAELTGRKNIVLLSVGFGPLNGFPATRPDPRYYATMTRTLNDSNVAVYPVDLLPNLADPGAVGDALKGSLTNLATDTGGTYYGQFATFAEPLRQIAEDTSGYYLLSYRAPHPRGEAGYQAVEVRTHNREFRVRFRQGYLYGDAAPETGGN